MRFVPFQPLILHMLNNGPFQWLLVFFGLRRRRRDRSKLFVLLTNLYTVSRRAFWLSFFTSREQRPLTHTSMPLRCSTRQGCALLASSGAVPMLLGMAFLSNSLTLLIQGQV